jgi:serine/threonine-protein kinase RsbW
MAWERSFALHVPSSTENLAMIRDFMKSVGTQAGLGDMDVARLELAVDEACANVMEHAYQDDQSQEVKIRAIVDDSAVQIEVIDTGKGFDPTTVEQLKLKELVSAKRTGGLGMRLMKSFMDEVHYEVQPGVKNELKMVKKLKKETPLEKETP